MPRNTVHLPIHADVERIAGIGPKRTQRGRANALSISQMEFEPLDMASHHGRAPVGFSEYALFGVDAGSTRPFKRK